MSKAENSVAKMKNGWEIHFYSGHASVIASPEDAAIIANSPDGPMIPIDDVQPDIIIEPPADAD